MKKFLTYMFVAVMAVVMLPSCNEDTDEDDSAYTQALQGTWSNTQDSENTRQLAKYQFKSNGSFIYEYTFTNGGEQTGWRVSGTWNFMHSQLQLKYNVESLETFGMSATETQSHKKMLEDSNLLLSEANAKGHAYGMTVKFTKVGGQRFMQMSGVAGTFSYQGVF